MESLRFDGFEERMDARFDLFEHRTDAMLDRCFRRLLVTMTSVIISGFLPLILAIVVVDSLR